MKKHEKILFRKLISIFFMILFLFWPIIGNASDWDISKDLPTASNTDISNTAGGVMDAVEGVIDTIATGLMVSMLVYIGIKIVTSAPEGRAEYKKMLLPYAIGVVIMKFAPDIIGFLKDIGDGNTNAANGFVGNYVDAFSTAVEYVGKTLAVTMLVIIGIKYVMAAPEGKAEYRKTMVPYVIGAVLIYTASSVSDQFVNHQYEAMVSEHLDDLQKAVGAAGIILATIMLLVIGIKYMTSAPEGKAEYRKIMLPYLIGAIIIFTTAVTSNYVGSNVIIKTIKTGAGIEGEMDIIGYEEDGTPIYRTYEEETRTVLSTVLNVLRYAGVGVSIIMLIVLAIKYMTTAPEGKAEVTKTMIPYFIGAVVLFAAGTFVGIIKTFATGLW